MNEHIKGLISVIVPVYNVENVLSKCIDSLLNQTYKHIEIILVNDGSKDKSGEICDNYSLKYNNVKVFHKENGGQSSARNLGIKNACGEFIAFVDSDDYVAEDMYMYLHSILKKYDADITSIKSIYVYSNIGETVQQPAEDVKIIEGKDILQHHMETTLRGGGCSICNCLFTRKTLEDNCFREGKIYEDGDYKYRAFSKANRYVISNQIMYYYLQSHASTSLSKFKNKDFDSIDATKVLLDLTKDEDYGTIRYLAKVKAARNPFSMLCRIAYLGIDDSVKNKKQVVKDFTKDLRKNYFFLLMSPLPLNRKMIMTLLVININCLKVPLFVFEKLRVLIKGKNQKLTQ